MSSVSAGGRGTPGPWSLSRPRSVRIHAGLNVGPTKCQVRADEQTATRFRHRRSSLAAPRTPTRQVVARGT